MSGVGPGRGEQGGTRVQNAGTRVPAAVERWQRRGASGHKTWVHLGTRSPTCHKPQPWPSSWVNSGSPLPAVVLAAGGRRGERPAWPQTAAAARLPPSAASSAWVLPVQHAERWGHGEQAGTKQGYTCTQCCRTFPTTGNKQVQNAGTPGNMFPVDDALTTHCKQTQTDDVLLLSRVLSAIAMISVIGTPQHSPQGSLPCRHGCFIRHCGHNSTQYGRCSKSSLSLNAA